MMRDLYIFDLDGTLALIDHRRGILDEKDDPQRWRRFYAACDRDLPNAPVLQVMERLRLFADVWFFSGRSEEVRSKTVEWICRHTSFFRHDLENILMMRQEGDYRADDVVKREWLENMLDEDRKRLCGVFDDRQRVVDMWRSEGITCFQVAPGNF